MCASVIERLDARQQAITRERRAIRLEERPQDRELLSGENDRPAIDAHGVRGDVQEQPTMPVDRTCRIGTASAPGEVHHARRELAQVARQGDHFIGTGGECGTSGGAAGVSVENDGGELTLRAGRVDHVPAPPALHLRSHDDCVRQVEHQGRQRQLHRTTGGDMRTRQPERRPQLRETGRIVVGHENEGRLRDGTHYVSG